MVKRIPTPDPQIKQYPDGSYWYRKGNDERPLHAKDFVDAIKKKEKLIAKLDQTGERAGRLRVTDVWADYVTARTSLTDGFERRKKPAHSTINEIKYVWQNHLKSFWGHRKLSGIDETGWDDYVSQARVTDLSNHRKVWTAFLKWCQKKKYIRHIPQMTIPSVERRERRVATPDELRRLFQHAKGHMLLFMSFATFMGMRRKEILTLSWDSVNLSQRYIIIQKQWVKTRKSRIIPLNSFVLQLLLQLKSEQRKRGIHTPWVFANRKDARRHMDVTALKTAWRTLSVTRCRFAAGYLTLHDLRATYEAYAHRATEFTDTQREKMAGASIDVQKRIYVHFDAEGLRGLEHVVSVEGLDEILESKLKSAGKTRGAYGSDSLH